MECKSSRISRSLLTCEGFCRFGWTISRDTEFSAWDQTWHLLKWIQCLGFLGFFGSYVVKNLLNLGISNLVGRFMDCWYGVGGGGRPSFFGRLWNIWFILIQKMRISFIWRISEGFQQGVCLFYPATIEGGNSSNLTCADVLNTWVGKTCSSTTKQVQSGPQNQLEVGAHNSTYRGAITPATISYPFMRPFFSRWNNSIDRFITIIGGPTLYIPKHPCTVYLPTFINGVSWSP